MNYTEREIDVVKQKAYDKGRVEGVIFALLIVIIFLIIFNKIN
jgi:hypothetical protein